MAKRNQKTVRNANETKQAQEAELAQAGQGTPEAVPNVEAQASVEALVVGEHGLIIACAQIDAGIQSNKLKLGDIMLGMAQSFCDAETGEFDLSGFEARCADEEKFIKSDAAGPNKTNRIPRTWIQYKSDIVKGAANFKLNPSDFQTISAHKKEITKARRAAKGGSTGGAAVGPKGDPELMQILVVIADLFDKQNDEGREDTLKDLRGLAKHMRDDVAANPRPGVKPVGAQAPEGLMDDPDEDSPDLSPEDMEELRQLGQEASRH